MACRLCYSTMKKETYDVIKYISLAGIVLGIVYLISYVTAFWSYAVQLNYASVLDYVYVLFSFFFSFNMFFLIALLFSSVYLMQKSKVAKNLFIIVALFGVIPALSRLYNDFTSSFSIPNLIEIISVVFFIVSGYYLIFNKIKREFK